MIDYNAIAKQFGATNSTAPGTSQKVDYNSLAKQFGGTASTVQPTVGQTPPDNRDFLQKAGDVVNSIFPGKQVGQAIGTLTGLGIEKTKGLFGGQDNSANYDTSAPTPLQVAGDIAQGALFVGSALPEAGAGEGVAQKLLGDSKNIIQSSSALGRIGANTLLGAGLGGTNAIAQGKDVGRVAKDTLTGAVTAGGISAGTEGVAALIDKLPTWLTKKALPKLNTGNTKYALENTKLGTVASNVEKSDKAVQSYGNQIHSILSHPQYANEVGDGSASLEGVIQAFPNAQLDAPKIAQIASDVVPGSEKLVDKISNGTATLLEKNQLRQQLDLATKKVFTDSPQLTFNKQVVHSFANSLRNEVQSVAPETEPIFNEFSKELNLNGALKSANKKIQKGAAIGLYDILGAMGGSVAGIPGSAAAVALEKIVRAPGVGLAAAKGVNTLGKSAPLFNGVIRATKAPAVKLFTNQ